MMPGLLALLVTLIMVTQLMAGTWTPNNFFYRPDVGARGAQEKTIFDSGLDRVDTRLGNEKWLNDPAFGGNLQAAITAIGSATTVLKIPSGTYPIASDLTIPANIALKLPRGAILNIANGITLTLNGGLEAGLYQIFSYTGTGKVVLNKTAKVFPEWWGAVANGSTDCAAAIQAAVTSLPIGGTVYFGPGEYALTPGTVNITTHGTILKGQGGSHMSVNGTRLTALAGTGAMVTFSSTEAGNPVQHCLMEDCYLNGAGRDVTGIKLYRASMSLNRVSVFSALNHGVHMEQVWDSSFYNLRIQSCGSVANTKAGLYIYNGADDNSNNVRFHGFHAEGNNYKNVWISSLGAGSSNHHILFMGGKMERSGGAAGTVGFYLTGSTTTPWTQNMHIIIRDMTISEFYQNGDIGVHVAPGYGNVLIDGCSFTNSTGVANTNIGIKLEAPATTYHVAHRITNNSFRALNKDISIEASCPRRNVWMWGNANTYPEVTDQRVNVNGVKQDQKLRQVLISEFVGRSTSGTGEDNLSTYTLPAGYLETYRGLNIKGSGVISGVAGNKTLKLYFGGDSTTIYPAGALGATWQFEAHLRMLDGSTSTYVLTWVMRVDGGATTSGRLGGSEDTTADVLIKLTGECANGADTITQQLWLVEDE